MSTHRMLSIIVPVTEDRDDLAQTHKTYRKSLDGRGWILQFVYVVDGDGTRAINALKALKKAGESLEILHLPHEHGEATALSVGFRYAKGDRIMTLPDVPEVTGDELGKLLDASDDNDLVVARRLPPDTRPKDRKFERAVKLLLNSPFKDLRSSVRVLHRQVADEITLYGEQHNFLSLIAQSHGFTVREVDVTTSIPPGKATSIGQKPNLVLDVLNAFFLIRFVKKPFRFFGGFGLAVLGLGVLLTAYLVAARLFLGVPLLDRPALILSSLMVVLGIQILSVGLIGEIITFAFTKEHRDYRVERIVD